jgi:Ser/Thr protein kinase RdoA (MazF antagonist)
MSVAHVEAAGTLLARLHEHGARFEGGRRQPVIVGDTVMSFHLADRIPRNDPHHGSLFADAMDRAQAAIDSLWAQPPHPPHLLHGDLHPSNVLVWRGRLTPIDFQDALWGFEIQDIAITISALESYPDAHALTRALSTGYERVRPWPADDTKLVGELVGARHLSQLNLGYNLQRPGFEEFVARKSAWLRNWMEAQ